MLEALQMLREREKRNSTDMFSRYPLQELAFRNGSIPKPDSDASGQVTLQNVVWMGGFGIGSARVGRCCGACLLQELEKMQALLCSYCQGAGVGCQIEVFRDVNTRECSVVPITLPTVGPVTTSRKPDVNNYLFCFANIQRQIVVLEPNPESIHSV